MKYLFFCAALIQPCQTLGIDLASPFSHSSYLFCIGGIIAFVLIACYIFYPAYKIAEGGLGCTPTVLVGGRSSDQEQILSLVIPAYNEEERLPIMLDSTLDYLNANRKHLTQLFRAVGGQREDSSKLIQCEFVIVNDGSTDDTEDVIKKYAANVKNGDTLKLVSMHKNCGKGGAVKTGMLQSSGQLCLMIDADGATDIIDGLPKVMKEIKSLISRGKNENFNSLLPAAVFGSRAHMEEESCASRSKIRTFLMIAFHFFVKALCSPRIKDTQCGFKLFTRSAVVLLFTNLHLRRWAFDTELVVIAEMLGISLSEVGVVWHEIDGSKLDVDKITLALVSLGMLRDMVCVRACYLLRIWKLR
ncbi:hypothetical protein ACHAXR_004369 [Thalassiosira sp. AJA248-18]